MVILDVCIMVTRLLLSLVPVYKNVGKQHDILKFKKVVLGPKSYDNVMTDSSEHTIARCYQFVLPGSVSITNWLGVTIIK